ncbi:MAG: hypothetical protein OXE74_08795 [Cyanobacteria bacterium MAG CAR2_bin_4]|nr:hypothetical protein [Cyanobacteria bacterium MAG CAR2_bin_4]
MVFSSPQRRIIRQRAGRFAEKWKGRQGLGEREHSEIFIDEFFSIFDIDCYISNIIFEYQLPSGRRIDVFWPGVLLIENKSLGKNLREAFEQARSYYEELEDYLRPQYILVNDFHNFRISSFRKSTKDGKNYWKDERRFSLSELPNNENINLFYYFSNHKYTKITKTREQTSENIVRGICIDNSIDDKPLESMIEHEVKRVMHGTKYAILKLTLASGLSLALGYLISDGQPREYMERFIGGSAREESIR